MKFDSIIALRTGRTVFRDGDRCIKVFENGSVKPSEVYSQARAHALAFEAGIRVPELIGVGELDGKLTMITDLIRGKTIARLIDSDKARADEYLELIVQSQLELNRVECSELESMKQRFSRRISECELSESRRAELTERLEALPDVNFICHGELVPDNVMISKSETVIVDWKEAFAGLPRLDAALSYLLLELDYPELSQRYLSIYCEQSSVAREEILSLLPIAAAARSVGRQERERHFMLEFAK